MKKVITVDMEENVHIDSIDFYTPIFAKQNNRLQGMLTYEKNDRWVLRIGGDSHATGWHKTRRECIKSCVKYGYTFYIV